MDKFREKIRLEGKRNNELARQFKIFEYNNSKTLDLIELPEANRDFMSISLPIMRLPSYLIYVM